MSLYQLNEQRPRLAAGAWVAENAVLIGNVELREDASVWWNTVIRADNDLILIGARSNVQDNSVLHTDPGIVLDIGSDVTIGHRVILHGCKIGNGSLIGMGSVIMNGAAIGAHSLIGANTLIPEGKSFPDGVLIMGSPGKVVRELNAEEIARIAQSAVRYVENAQRFAVQLKRVS